jgi:hypothetical protein
MQMLNNWLRTMQRTRSESKHLGRFTHTQNLTKLNLRLEQLKPINNCNVTSVTNVTTVT